MNELLWADIKSEWIELPDLDAVKGCNLNSTPEHEDVIEGEGFLIFIKRDILHIIKDVEDCLSIHFHYVGRVLREARLVAGGGRIATGLHLDYFRSSVRVMPSEYLDRINQIRDEANGCTHEG